MVKYNLHTEEGIKHKRIVLRAFMKRTSFSATMQPPPGSGNRTLPAPRNPRGSLPGHQPLSPLERTTVPASLHETLSSILLIVVYHRFASSRISLKQLKSIHLPTALRSLNSLAHPTVGGHLRRLQRLATSHDVSRMHPGVHAHGLLGHTRRARLQLDPVTPDCLPKWLYRLRSHWQRRRPHAARRL